MKINKLMKRQKKVTSRGLGLGVTLIENKNKNKLEKNFLEIYINKKQ